LQDASNPDYFGKSIFPKRDTYLNPNATDGAKPANNPALFVFLGLNILRGGKGGQLAAILLKFNPLGVQYSGGKFINLLGAMVPVKHVKRFFKEIASWRRAGQTKPCALS